MNVLLLTIFISLVLAIIFIGMFVLQSARGSENGGSAERDSLLPLDDADSFVDPKPAVVPIEKHAPTAEKL